MERRATKADAEGSDPEPRSPRRPAETAGVAGQEASARDEIVLLYRLTTAVGRAVAAEEVYDLALDALQRGLHIDQASVLLRDRDGVMRFVAWRGLSRSYRQLVEGHSPWSAEERDWQPLFVPDVEVDESLQPFLPALRAEGIRALGFIPLTYGEQLLGKFMLYSAEPRHFTEHDARLAGAIADHVAWAVGRMRTEAAVREADRRKDEFLAILGHELRNPLAPIRTALQLMRSRGGGEYERERTVIERQVSHLVRLIDDLLDVSRITRGKVDLHLERIELAEVLESAVETVAPLLEQRHQTLTIDVPPTDLAVRVDPDRLAQVLSNVLNNAAKFTDPGGSIEVQGGVVGGDVVTCVRDTGRGLAPEIVPRVFDMFAQESQPIDRAQGGLGLGLSIVKHLVELHGGRVEAASPGRGQGSTFTIRLPRAPAEPEDEPAQRDTTAQGQQVGVRVLVVDDNIDAAEMLEALLSSAGYTVRAALDAASALRIAAELEPDVAILDIGLPEIDGYELAARLRVQPRLADIDIVALSGYAQPEDRLRSARAGFGAHLAKPVELDELLATIARLSRRRTQQSAADVPRRDKRRR